MDRMELIGLDFLNTVAEGYRKIALDNKNIKGEYVVLVAKEGYKIK